jgi:hypothetical protein
MGIGVFFILVLALAVIAILCAGLYVIAAWLRHEELSEGGEQRGRPEEGERRPRRRKVKNEQRTRFVGSR